MHFTLSFLSLTLILTGSLADMCYEGIEVREEDEMHPCAAGRFDQDSLPPSVEIVDCGRGGCKKSVLTRTRDETNRKYTYYMRDCASSIFTKDQCFDLKRGIDITKIRERIEEKDLDYEYHTLVCRGDYCNGAGSLKALQALMASVVGLLVIA